MIQMLDAAAVDRALPRIDVVDCLAAMFEELGSARAVQPPQTVTPFPAGGGDFITYLGVLAGRGIFGAKLSPYIVTEARPVVTAWTCLMSMTTGQPLLLCDSKRLTTERTAGTTALAVRHLAPDGARRAAIIGAGAVASAHLRHVAGLRDWQEIAVWSPGLGADSARQADWQAAHPAVRLAASAEAAVRQADVVLLCTSSGTPVMETDWLAPGALVTSISTNVAQAHEVDPAFLTQADVYCDYRATTPGSAGEMVLAARDHGWSADHIRGDLPELECGACPPPTGDRPVFFRSIGLGLEDIAVAAGLLDDTRNGR